MKLIVHVMIALGMLVLNKTTSVAKGIQNFTFADSSENYICVTVTPRRPKTEMVAVEIKPTEKQLFESVLFMNLGHSALTRLAGA